MYVLCGYVFGYVVLYICVMYVLYGYVVIYLDQCMFYMVM